MLENNATISNNHEEIVVLSPEFKKFEPSIYRAIEYMYSSNPTIQDMRLGRAENISEDGKGKTWSWINAGPIGAQANLTASLDLEDPNELKIVIKSVVTDNRIKNAEESPLKWEWIFNQSEWDIDQLKDYDEGEQFVFKIAADLFESLDALRDKEIIAESIGKKK